LAVDEAKKIWTVRDLMEWTTPYLSERHFENSRLNVEWLLCHTLQCQRVDLYADYERPLDKTELESFRTNLKRRTAHEPLQYIVGSAEFMGLNFEVDREVLIPRSDTEILVEKTLEICKTFARASETLSLLDIGTGSGAIAVSVAYFLKKQSIPFVITAIDSSPKAIALAQRNAERIIKSESIHFICGNIFDDSDLEESADAFDIIVSNPPYISDQEFDELPEDVKNYEPHEALRAEDNGLAFYKHISKIAPKLFRSANAKRILLFETGYDQAAQVKKIMLENNFTDIEIVKDYQQVERAVKGTLT
jgi:release factor glutamine methyltransferase